MAHKVSRKEWKRRARYWRVIARGRQRALKGSEVQWRLEREENSAMRHQIIEAIQVLYLTNFPEAAENVKKVVTRVFNERK